MSAFRISEVRFLPAPEQYRASGHLGWVSCVMDGAVGIALGVRRTLDGRLTLAFPARHDGSGRLHNTTWPVDQESRDAFESQVFGELEQQGRLP